MWAATQPSNVVRARRVCVALGLLAAFALLVALTVGSFDASPARLLRALFTRDDVALASVIFDLRLPRALSAFAVGALLALSGAILQALLRNPLADPYVLGISGGAAVMALSALALGAALWLVQLAAASGALLTLLLLFALARRALMRGSNRGNAWHSNDDAATVGILLTGVMLAALCAALLGLLLSLAPEARLRSMVFWLLGDLGGATDVPLALGACVLAVVLLLIAQSQARGLNLVLRGDVQAMTQGVDVVRTRRVLVIVSAIATAGAVTLAGAVGFVGFVAPHLLRMSIGNDQRWLLPSATLAGGVLVVLADTLARTLAAPVQLPVGVITALIGVPVFLWLLRRQ